MSTPTPLPPGSSGWPILGETLPFLNDMFGFIQRKTALHGPVFRTKILGSPTVIISGPQVTEEWLDESKVMREGSFPKPVRELFGGRSLPLLDGQEHQVRKQLLMAGFGPQALAAYLPVLNEVVGRALAQWADAGEQPLVEPLKRLAVEGIAAAVLGLAPGPSLDAMLADYRLVTLGFTGIPLNVPGGAYAAALKARDRILDRLEAMIVAHRATPATDGLSRICAAVAADGTVLTVEQMKLELHHVMLAGLIIFAEFAATLTALDQNPGVRARLEEELRRVAPTGPLGPQHLREMPLLLQTVMEVKRWCPNVPVSFGKAREDFTVGGFNVPKGWLVFMAVGQSNHDASVYAEPSAFDPDRFGPERAEHEKHANGFMPQGAGTLEGHKCAGLDFSTLFMQIFTARLLRDYRFVLPEQDLGLRRNLVPPEPRDGLRAVISRSPVQALT